MPDSLSLARYREVLRNVPSLGEKIVEVYQHGNGQLSLRYANGRLSRANSLDTMGANAIFHPDILALVETRFIIATGNLPDSPFDNILDLNVRMIYVISGVFLDLGGGYHFRTPIPLSSSVSSLSSRHHHRCSRCKKVRVCSGRYCYHQLKLHCDDCNEYFLLKRGRDADNISLNPETSIPLNINNAGANWVWPAPLPEARPAESGSGGVASRPYTVTFNDNPNAASWSLDESIRNWVVTNDANSTGRTGGNEDSNL